MGAVAQAAPETPRNVTLEDFHLTGDLSAGRASFTLTAIARVESSRGGRLPVLSGPVALTEIHPHPKWRVEAEDNQFILRFDHGGKFPVELKFQAAIHSVHDWNEIHFRTASSTLQPIHLRGLPADTQFDFTDAARPEYRQSEFVSFLGGDGSVNLRWKEARPEGEGKLFYAAEMLSQVSVSPGLLRQVAWLDFKVMQGELNQVSVILHGNGDVTRVQGEAVLAWNIEPLPNSADRHLLVRFNQPQKDHFVLQVQSQAPLSAFPATAEVLQLRPESATHFAGYFRVVNEGAVRLEVVQAGGLSQISPEQFPETDLTRSLLPPDATQRFAYRFSGPDFGLTVQADQIVPELNVSELLNYRLGESEQSIEGEFEFDIREAPLRELTLRVPRGYVVAQLNAAGLNDYFLVEPENQTEAELRLVFGQPITGRQVAQFRLERNQPLGQATWTLPRITIPKAKSVRGHIATTADPGFRLTPERTSGLTEIATAFFPRKVAGIQSAFRLSDPEWQAVVRVERLAQTVQADVLHLFSIGEGIAYGSSVMNYAISGSPVSTFRIELSDEYFNVEFTGKDIRNWQKVPGGYQVQLHTPTAGPYTLLATYERPFKSQGETLTFTGARPLEAQSEQGYTLVISAYQFQVKPVDVSATLVPLEPGEVPAEYRLLFDAPILAAYRYSVRPFDLKLALSPLTQGDSLSLVVDRASLATRISKEGQVLTDVRYFLKNRGNPQLRLELPAGTRLWSASVNGVSVVPVTDATSNLIPLPQGGDPNAVLTLDLKLASVSNDPRQVRIAAPVINAPIMLAQWKLDPDAGQRLVYRRGSLTPASGVPEASGFAQIARYVASSGTAQSLVSGLAAVAAMALGLIALRWAGGAAARLNTRHTLGLVLAASALITTVALLNMLAGQLAQWRSEPTRDLSFLAPIQQAGSALNLEVANLSDRPSLSGVMAWAWPGLLSLPLWFAAWIGRVGAAKRLAAVFGWLALCWAALRAPNGAVAFLIIIGAFGFIHLVVPMFVLAWRLPPLKLASPIQKPAPGAASAAVAFLLGGSLLVAEPRSYAGTASPTPAMADLVSQQIRAEDNFALATVTIHWQAEKGQVLPLLCEPAVLTHIQYPAELLKLEQDSASAPTNRPWLEQLVAKKSGNFEVELRYEIGVCRQDAQSGFYLPVRPGLVNRLELSLANLDVDVSSPQGVSVEREFSGSNTVASLVLSPADRTWVGWKPRARDVKSEKPVFYAELAQLYAPTAGVIEGEHLVTLRLAQGELRELVLDIPDGVTVTDVLDPTQPAQNGGNTNTPSIVALWRFDPDARKLRVTLSPPQARPFKLLVRSQVAIGPLPIEQHLGLLRVAGAAEQIGLVGLATGNEVQLDSANTESLSAINLEDFPGGLVTALQAQISGLTLHRAFRYADPAAAVSLKASAVEPDIRVESQDTISFGEDRTVLAANTTVNISRAGIFRLSFVMPAGFDVESVSGSALSHWTESASGTNRVITLHLNGKTEGHPQFAISLAGPGVRATNNWAAPQLVLREAGKQTGTLLLVPEQGLRLQVVSSDGLSQLDPQKSGIKQKGVLAFRVLQIARSLGLNIEQINAWIQVSSLQHVSVGEAQMKIAANLQYQIENAGLKSFRILIPTNAEGVRFQAEQLSDFLPAPGGVTNGLEAWEVRLHRRVMGAYLVQVTYQLPIGQNATQVALRGVEAAEVNLQRGFVTIESGGRLQVRIDSTPAALQLAEWQSIPRVLTQGMPANTANYTYRLVEADFDLPLRLERYQATQLLPGRINSISFRSVISDDGVMLTQARLEMLPGQKRLLRMTLPPQAHFWFAFVNQNGVWPWREQDQILIPLEQQALGDKPVPVELFYTCKIGAAGQRSLDLQLPAPEFDLPLENITWRVCLSDKWRLTKWSGSLQWQGEELIPQAAALDVQNYLQNENLQEKERTKKAEDYLAAANSALAQGDPQQARRAFQSAFGLSTHDAAFNEDTRVQLHNIKLQEALVGLNVRQAVSSGDSGALSGKLRELRERKVANYTQQDAKDIIERNSSDENAAFMKLAERLIQQQDAATAAPAALHASIPEQGRALTFSRAVLVDPWSALKLNLTVTATTATSWVTRGSLLAGALLLLLGLSWVARSQGQGVPRN